MNVKRVELQFDDLDKQIIAWLAKHFDGRGEMFDFSDLQSETNHEPGLLDKRLDRFSRYGLVEPETLGGEVWSIQPQLLSVAEQLSAPEPQPDRIEEFTRRFRSRRYAVPLWLLGVVIPAVVLPAVVGWVAIIRWLLGN